jgi:hypothetical protein
VYLVRRSSAACTTAPLAIPATANATPDASACVRHFDLLYIPEATAPFVPYIHSVRWPLAHEHEGVGDRFVVVEEVPLGVSRVERLQSPETPVAGISHNRPAVCEPPLQFSDCVMCNDFA